MILPGPPAAVGASGYRSSVSSSHEAPLDELIRAIDELAAASQAGAAPGHLDDRIARLWAMVAALDPELARRRSRYERPSGGRAGPAAADDPAGPDDPGR